MSVDAVLLSAVAGESGFVSATHKIAGVDFLSRQVRQLRNLGIKDFFVEVDQISGALLAISDALEADGVSVKFVRKAAELAQQLETRDRLLIVAASTYPGDPVVKKMLASGKPVILTVADETENTAFERIDLATRWSGIAVVETAEPEKIAEIPEGWSLPSAMLRQALQEDVEQLPLGKEDLKARAVARVDSEEQAVEFAKQSMQGSKSAGDSLLGGHLLEPAAQWLTTKFHQAAHWSPAAAVFFTLLCTAAAWLDWPITALLFAALSLFTLTLQRTIKEYSLAGERLDPVQAGSWLLLSSAFLALCWHQAANDGLFLSLCILGLLFFSEHYKNKGKNTVFKLDVWMVILLLLGGAALSVFAVTLKLTLAFQILALLLMQRLAGQEQQG